MQWIPDSRYCIQVFVGKTWILDFNCERDTGFLEQYSGFQSLRFRVPRAQYSRIPHFANNYFTDSGFQ